MGERSITFLHKVTRFLYLIFWSHRETLEQKNKYNHFLSQTGEVS